MNILNKSLGRFGFRYFSSQPAANKFLLSHSIHEPPTKDPSKLPFLITHGLLGSKNNFNSIAKAVARSTGRQVVTFDARNHGDSPHADDISYDAMAEDIKELLTHLKITKFSLMGHSMGGRTVMTFALKNPDVIEKLVVVDVAPLAKVMDMETMKSFIRLMLSVQFDSNVRQISDGRKMADNLLKKTVDDAALRAFLLTNLAHKDGKFYWKPNLPILLESLHKIGEFPDHLLLSEFSSPTLFIKGELSPYIREKDFPTIQKTFINSKLIVINGSGHWPHADNTTIFVQHLLSYLK